MTESIRIGAAFLAGVLGGVLGALLVPSRQQTDTQTVVRAQKFELQNEGGNVISYWGVDKGDNVVLAFGSRPGTVLMEGAVRPIPRPFGLRNPDNQLAAVGLLANDSPFLTFRGADGKTRVRMLLNDWAKPALLMEDETGPRLRLGIEQSDTPNPRDNDWTLDFSPDSRARIGIYTERVKGQTYVRGIFSVREDQVKYP